ncbi:hypothetical protein HMPREF0454_02380 [Hafnia alvei ATCC 51873]|uniref:Uncharacterized protein n=1 Tax=Hafnia alvei ATCC 51873 TaxID=1002364 RepID=G9Y729_HAFAL|nr:hypothetical protein HMPREF0454_02380 [Hafnia alvei ATCC 51873]
MPPGITPRSTFIGLPDSGRNLIVKELAASGDLVCCRVDGVKITCG